MLEGIDLESPFNTFRVLSSTIMPLPEYGIGLSAEFLVSVFLLLLESFDFLDFDLPELKTMHLMKRSCDWTRRFSKSDSTDFDEEDSSFFLAVMYSSISLRRLVFSSRKVSRDCSSSEVSDFLRKRLFFACLRFRSLSSKGKKKKKQE